MGNSGLQEAMIVVEIEEWDHEPLTVIIEGFPPQPFTSQADKILESFVSQNPAAANMKQVLKNLIAEFLSSKDANQYYSQYASLLLRAEEFASSPKTVLEILQKLFHDLQVEVCVSSKKTVEIVLTEEDEQILEYVGGFVIRKLYFHPTTCDLEKTLLKKIECDVKKGSIAFERNRDTAGNEKELKSRLWGICRDFLRLLKSAEVYFRQHTLTHLNKLNINNKFFQHFKDKEDFLRAVNFLCVDTLIPRTMAESILEKCLRKFMKVQAHSYAKHLTGKLSKGSNSGTVHGLRRSLKT